MRKISWARRHRFPRFASLRSPPTDRRHIRRSSAASKTDVQIYSQLESERKYEWMYACCLRERSSDWIHWTDRETAGLSLESPGSTAHDRLHNLWIPDGTEWMRRCHCIFEFRADWLTKLFVWMERSIQWNWVMQAHHKQKSKYKYK